MTDDLPTVRYGKSLIADFEDCNVEAFNRENIDAYFVELCSAIGVEKEDLHFWDDVDVPLEDRQTDPRLSGTSAIQFILTSSIVIHALDLTGDLFLDVFSCDDFDSNVVIEVTLKHFSGRLQSPITIIARGKHQKWQTGKNPRQS